MLSAWNRSITLNQCGMALVVNVLWFHL